MQGDKTKLVWAVFLVCVFIDVAGDAVSSASPFANIFNVLGSTVTNSIEAACFAFMINRYYPHKNIFGLIFKYAILGYILLVLSVAAIMGVWIL